MFERTTDAINTTAAAKYDPVFKAFAGFEPSPPLTNMLPMMDASMPIPESTRGKVTAFIEAPSPATTTPRATAETMAPTYDSKRSAPMPATSPTLSPTLSAITAGFLGSSSGMPASTFPTRSAPTSAALVYIPPPTRANRAIDDAPSENPIITLSSPVSM